MRPAPAQAAGCALNVLYRHLGDFFRFGGPLAGLYLLLHGLDKLFAHVFGVVYSTANFVFGLTWLIEPFVCALFCILWMRLLLGRDPRLINPLQLHQAEMQFAGAAFLVWAVVVDLPRAAAGFLTPDGHELWWLAVFAPLFALALWGVSLYAFYFPARATRMPWTARQSRKASFNLRGPMIKAGLMSAGVPAMAAWAVYLLRVKLAESALAGFSYFMLQTFLLTAWALCAFAGTALAATIVCHYLQWYRKTGRSAPWVDRDAPS